MNNPVLCNYTERIRKRSTTRFIIGLIPRIYCWLNYAKYRRKAKKQCAHIGTESIILSQLSRKANPNLYIGNYSSIGTTKLDLRSPIHIGNFVIISNDSEIITTSHYIDSPEWEHKCYGIEIEDYVWIASNALILPSCRKIGYGAVIGAGAVVTKDVPPMSVMGGNPAQCIKMRKCVHDKLVVPSLLSGDLKIYWKTWMSRKKY